MTALKEEKKEKEKEEEKKEEKKFLRRDGRAHQSKVVQEVPADLKIVFIIGSNNLNSDLNTLS